MFKNTIKITVIISLALMSISILFLSIGGQFLQEYLKYDYSFVSRSSDDFIGMIGFGSGGILGNNLCNLDSTSKKIGPVFVYR